MRFWTHPAKIIVQKEYPKFLLLSENPTKNYVNKILLFIFQNDMGLKPHDCAKVMGQKECAEFLLLYETSLEMAKELYEVHTKREVLMAEHNELRSYFK